MRPPQQKPRSPGLRQTKNAATWHLFRRIKGRGRPNDAGRRDAKSRLEIYRRLQSRDYSIACGISREARRLRSINHTSLWLGAWTPTPRTHTARSAACRCNCGAHRPRIIWVPPIPVSTATGAASSSTSRRARRLWNSPRQRSRRARFLPSACGRGSCSKELRRVGKGAERRAYAMSTFMLHAWLRFAQPTLRTAQNGYE